jgi:transcriptional regulator with XRE-family HTH domain
MLTPMQCRMARAGLGWTIAELSKRTGVNRETISHFEIRRTAAIPATVAVIQRAFEEAGVTFRGDGCVCAPTENAEG